MKKYRVYFELQRDRDFIELEAESEDAAEQKFSLLSADDVLDRAGIVPEFEVEEVDEVAE